MYGDEKGAPRGVRWTAALAVVMLAVAAAGCGVGEDGAAGDGAGPGGLQVPTGLGEG
jgi:hypothetical protein